MSRETVKKIYDLSELYKIPIYKVVEHAIAYFDEHRPEITLTPIDESNEGD